MERTTALGVLLVVVLAGCVGGHGTGGGATDAPPTETPEPTKEDPTPNDYQTAPNRTPTATQTPTEDPPAMGEDGYYNSFTFEASPVSAAGIAADLSRNVSKLDGDERAVVATALENGSATVTDLQHGEGPPESVGPVEEGAVVRQDGTFYRVDATVQEWRSDAGYGFQLVGPLEAGRTEYDPGEVEATPLSSLSAVERDLVTLRMPEEPDDSIDDRRRRGSVIASFNYLPEEGTSLEGSPLLDGEPFFVERGGDVFLVQFEEEHPRVTRSRVRYTVEPVAGSPEAFLDGRLEGLVRNVTADVPPEPVRGIVLSAIANGTHEWTGTVETRPEAVEKADEWVDEQSATYPVAYLRYEGEIYRIDVREVIE
jgi:hypothetical protein